MIFALLEVFGITQVTLFGLAAAITSIVGCILAVASYIANRRSSAEKANQEMHQELIRLREENEKMSQELHKLRLRRPPNE
jgi:hypothetical protein